MAHYACKNAHRDKSEIYNYQRFNFQIINTLASLYTDARAIFRPICAFSTVSERTKNYFMQMYTGTRLTTVIHRRPLSRFFLREGGRLYTGYSLGAS